MAQQIITLCDACPEGDQRQATPTVVTLGKGRPTVVDLCVQHEAEIVEPLRALLGEHGRSVEPGASPETDRERRSRIYAAYTKRQASAASAPLPCLLCNVKADTRDQLNRHYQRAHDLPRTIDVYGDPVCPLCGKMLAQMNALGAHDRTHPEAHGDGVHGLFREALEAGDPHGVIARRREVLTGKAAA